MTYARRLQTCDPPLIAKRLGERLKQLRNRAGVGTREVAARMGSYHPIVTRLETGRHVPTIVNVCLYAQAIGVAPSAVLSCLDEVVQ